MVDTHLVLQTEDYDRSMHNTTWSWSRTEIILGVSIKLYTFPEIARFKRTQLKPLYWSLDGNLQLSYYKH